eukprot:1162046-Pelagomonas_calceolata.AAC.15
MAALACPWRCALMWHLTVKRMHAHTHMVALACTWGCALVWHLTVDVYSFGIVMWELWTGREPYDGLNYHALLHAMTSCRGMRPVLPGKGCNLPERATQLKQKNCQCDARTKNATCSNSQRICTHVGRTLARLGAPDWDGEPLPELAPDWVALMVACWAEEPTSRPSFRAIVLRLQVRTS